MNNESKDRSNLNQILINKAAKVAISSQVKSVGNLDVNLDSDISQLLQGETTALKIVGEKIIAVKDIHLEKIDIVSQDLSLNLTQAILGKITFEQPGNFEVKVVFTKSDCDRLLNSEYVRTLLQSLVLDIFQQPANFYLQQAECIFAPNSDLSLIATIILHREQQIKNAQFKISFQFYQEGLGIKFISGQYLGEQSLDFDETVAIMNKVQDLLYLRHFTNDDLALNLTKILIEDQQLILQGNAQIKRLPDSISQSIKSVASEINER